MNSSRNNKSTINTTNANASPGANPNGQETTTVHIVVLP